jgi:hypothetical protein
MELTLNYTQEEEATIAIVLIFILGSVRVILLIEVVLWRESVLLSSGPCKICLVVPIDIGINVCQLSLRLTILVLIPCIKAALGV